MLVIMISLGLELALPVHEPVTLAETLSPLEGFDPVSTFAEQGVDVVLKVFLEA